MHNKPRAYYNEIDKYAAEWLRNLILCDLIADGDVDERSIHDVTPNDLRGYTQCHFFAGIGVWSAALRSSGWPDSRPIWTGSCPCQPFSSAGSLGGFGDERHLWPHFHHLIAQCKPAIVVGEQVASKDGLAWLDLVQSDLEGEGYAFGAVDTCAAGVGAPHIRQRLYFVGDAGYSERGGWDALRYAEEEPGCEASEGKGTGLERFGTLNDVANDGAGDELADALSGGQSGQGGSRGTQEQRITECGLPSELANAECERSRGRSNGDSGGSSGALQAEGRSTPSGLGDTEHDGFVTDAFAGGNGSAIQYDEEGENGAFELAGASRPEPVPQGITAIDAGPTNGMWRDADWLLCRDGKWRAVEPGTFPLVNGASARVGRLRAYGNAINKKNAEVFISAIMDLDDVALA